MNMDEVKKQTSDAFDREAGVQRFIICCSCFNMKKKASEAFSLMFPGEVLPQVINGRDRIYKFASVHNNKHIEAISKLSGRFAYYIELLGDEIVKEYDLVKGSRIA